jgi:subtilisin family serine protease
MKILKFSFTILALSSLLVAMGGSLQTPLYVSAQISEQGLIEEQNYKPDSVVVEFEENYSEAEVKQNILNQNQVSTQAFDLDEKSLEIENDFTVSDAIKEVSEILPDLEIDLKPNQDIENAIDQLEGVEGVKSVKPNLKLRRQAYLPDDTLYDSEQWYLKDQNNGIKAESGWEILGQSLINGFTACEDHLTENVNCSGDRDVKIAIIDSGVHKNALPTANFDETNAARFYRYNSNDGTCNEPSDTSQWFPGLYAEQSGSNIYRVDNEICMASGPGTMTETVEINNLSWDSIPDIDGHGTAIASVIGMPDDSVGGIGIASNVTILPIGLQVDEDREKIGQAELFYGILYAIDNNVDVINLSLGVLSNNPDDELQNMRAAIDLALDAGITVVAAAGNNGSSSYMYPASFDGVVSVGAIRDDLTRSSYSNYNSEVDLVVPIDKVTGTDGVLAVCGVNDPSWDSGNPCLGQNIGDVSYWRGTSFAAPQVSAAAGLLVSLYENGELPSKDPAFIEGVLQSSADDLGPSGKDNEFGYGLLNIEDSIFAFPDVSKSSTFGTFIYDLKKDNVIGGYSDGNFRPENNVDRAAMAKFIYNGFNFTPNTSCGDFPDVPTSSGFYTFITTLKCEGIIGGFSDGTFKPSVKVDRGASMKFTINALRQKAANPSDFDYNSGISNPFSDLSSSHPFYEFIVVGADQGIIGGYSNGTFQTGNTLTRGAMSKIISNARTNL